MPDGPAADDHVVRRHFDHRSAYDSVGDPERSIGVAFRRVARAVACAALFAFAAISSSIGASSSVTVTLTVPSAVSITNDCAGPAATELGSVLPGAVALTGTGPGMCSVGFQSSNDSAMLRLGQADSSGAAMTLASGTWTWSVPQSISRLYGASFYDSSMVMAVGTGGQVRRSMDGGASWPAGATWSNVTGGGSNVLRDVRPVPGNANTWYAVGGGRSVIKITNATSATPTFASAAGDLGAKGWGASEVVRALAVIDALTVVIVGDAGRIAHTADGGSTWTVYQVGTTTWNDIDRVDSTTYWLAGSSGRLAYSTGGFAGAGNWTQLSLPSFNSFDSIAVGDASHVYTSGNLGDIYACITSPCTNVANWASRGNVDLLPEGIPTIAANGSAPNTVYVATSYGHVAKSIDGAVTFQLQRSTTSSFFGAVALDPAGTRAVAAGADATVALTVDLSTWAVVTSGATPLSSVAYDPTNARRVVAVGSAGTVRTSVDGGATWTSVVPTADPEGDPLFGVAFGSRTAVWAVGDRGSILRSEDGGATWSAQVSGVTGRLWSVSAVDGRTAFAVGEAGVVLKTANGGATWSSVAPAATTATIRGVSAFPSGRVVIVGHSGYLRFSADSGATWAAPASVPSAKLVDVSMASDLVGYAATTSFVYKTVNGGANWALMGSGGNAVHAVSPSIVWIGSSVGVTRASVDGGATWRSVFTGATSYSYSDIAGVDGSTAIAVGQAHAVGLTGASGAANAAVGDYAGAPNDWTTASSSVFGMCLQGVSAQTVVNTPTFSATGTPPCAATDAHPWKGVPQSLTKIGNTTAAGQVGRVDIVWGFRPAANQAPGAYTAAVAFEALAPNA